MENRTVTKWDTIKQLLWFIIIVELFIFFLAVICGYACGYKRTFIAFGVLGGIIGGGLFGALIFITGIDMCIRFITKTAFYNSFFHGPRRRR
jgi:hypothetical protein